MHSLLVVSRKDKSVSHSITHSSKTLLDDAERAWSHLAPRTDTERHGKVGTRERGQCVVLAKQRDAGGAWWLLLEVKGPLALRS